MVFIHNLVLLWFVCQHASVKYKHIISRHVSTTMAVIIVNTCYILKPYYCLILLECDTVTILVAFFSLNPMTCLCEWFGFKYIWGWPLWSKHVVGLLLCNIMFILVSCMLTDKTKIELKYEWNQTLLWIYGTKFILNPHHSLDAVTPDM